jgi:prepilin-type processing-associated H-X9-DG protein
MSRLGLSRLGIDPTQSQDVTQGINDWNWGALPPVFGTLGTWSLAGSMHPGGCHFALGDGSVRFVSETTPFAVLTQMSTISEGTVAVTE